MNWLLPEGMDDILPDQAEKIEQLRREMLDICCAENYRLVIPPLMEYSASLLAGHHEDLALSTFLFHDHHSGRQLGLRADVTTQTARIDAHRLCHNEVNRLCYVETVVHTHSQTMYASRCPIQLGAELYGVKGLQGDLEILLLLVRLLRAALSRPIVLSLGDTQVLETLLSSCPLPTKKLLIEALRHKSPNDVRSILSAHSIDAAHLDAIVTLTAMHGDIAILDEAHQFYANKFPAIGTAIDNLRHLTHRLKKQVPDLSFYFDLSEYLGYRYHTGLVFAAYLSGYNYVIANGGRCDGIGAPYGKSRPAIGMNTHLKTLASLVATSVQ